MNEKLLSRYYLDTTTQLLWKLRAICLMLIAYVPSLFAINDNSQITTMSITAQETSVIQQHTITGTVVDAVTGESIIGASIIMDGTTTGVISGNDGKFTLEIPKQDAIIIVSFIGYKTEKVAVNGQPELNIKLIPNAADLEEVVVIGYGAVKKKDLSGAVGVVKADQMDQAINTNVGVALQGKIAGVNIMQNSGQPGSPMSIRIRGLGTVNNRDPLIIVDDVPVIPTDLTESTGTATQYVKHDPLSGLNPNDIESVQVLKDASAAAIYGTRAANGVILITTKSGKKGPIKVDASVDFGVQELAKKIPLCTADEWLKIMSKLYEGQEENIPVYAKNPALIGKGTDWQDEVYRKALMQNYSIGASGGSDQLHYSASIGYLNQDGIMKTTGYDRLSLHFKSDFTKGRFKIGESLTFSKESYNEYIHADYTKVDFVPNILSALPVMPVRDADGNWGNISNVVSVNPIAMLNMFNQDKEWYRFISNLYAEVSLTGDLKFKTSISVNGDISNTKVTRQRGSLGNVYTNTLNNARYVDRKTVFWQIENTLSYNKIIAEKHSINAVIGQSAMKKHYSQVAAYKEGMPDGIWELGAATQNVAASGYSNENTMASYLGRLIYSYNNKYIFTGTLRRDGSSRFGRVNPWGNFPSLALAWNVANESFFKNLAIPVSELKVRASWGKLGNQEIGDYKYIAGISPGINYAIGNNLWPGSIQTDAVSSELKWEATISKNIGLDFSLWGGKLSYSLDLYQKTTTDMLMAMQVPSSLGYSSSLTINAGKMSNKGFEMAFTYHGQSGNFNYSIATTLSHNKNKVIELLKSTDVWSYGRNLIKPGYPIYGFWHIKTDGLFRSQDEINDYKNENGSLIQPNAKIGDIKFVDYNGDGKISDGVTDGDLQYCGSPFPDYEYGLRMEGSWKFIDVTLYFQGTQGNKIYNGTYLNANFERNCSSDQLNSYSFNPNSDVPRISLVDANYNKAYGGILHLEDGSYCRLKTSQIGFTFPEKLSKKLGITKCRLYIAAENLFTLTKYSGYNPEIGGNGAGGTGTDFDVYPLSKTYHMGLQLNF